MHRYVLAAALALSVVRSAAADFADAIEAYDQGDYATTFAETRPLAERGDADAQYMLGFLYERGEGVARDLTRAYAWYGLAARQGDAFAAQALAELARRMTAAEIAEAEAFARVFGPDGD